MAYAGIKILMMTIPVILLYVLISGCVGPQETMERMNTLLTRGKDFGWEGRLSITDEEFSLLDILSPFNEWPFFIKEDAKYVWIYMDVNFSNPLKEDWSFLNHGRINITFTDPLEQKLSYSYSTTLGGPDGEKKMVFVSQPVSGQWHVNIKAIGTGSYTIRVEAYQSEE